MPRLSNGTGWSVTGGYRVKTDPYTKGSPTTDRREVETETDDPIQQIRTLPTSGPSVTSPAVRAGSVREGDKVQQIRTAPAGYGMAPEPDTLFSDPADFRRRR